VLLGVVSCLVDFFCVFHRTRAQLFGFVLDFLVKSRQDWEDRTLDVLLGFDMSVDQTLHY